MGIVHEITVLRPGKARQLQYVLAAALVSGIVAGVMLFDGTPPGAGGATPYLIGTTGVLLLATVILQRRNRVPVQLVRRPDGTCTLIIADRVDPAEFLLPVACRRSFTSELVRVGRHLRYVPVLVVGILDASGTPQVVFKEQLGTAYSPPAGWSQGDMLGSMAYVMSIGIRPRLDRFWDALVALGAKEAK